MLKIGTKLVRQPCYSIQYGVGILHASQNESKNLKKSLKVVVLHFLISENKSIKALVLLIC